MASSENGERRRQRSRPSRLNWSACQPQPGILIDCETAVETFGEGASLPSTWSAQTRRGFTAEGAVVVR